MERIIKVNRKGQNVKRWFLEGYFWVYNKLGETNEERNWNYVDSLGPISNPSGIVDSLFSFPICKFSFWSILPITVMEAFSNVKFPSSSDKSLEVDDRELDSEEGKEFNINYWKVLLWQYSASP